MRPIAQQSIGNLDENASSITKQRISSDRTTMIEVDQNFEPTFDSIVRLDALDMRDKANAACIMLVSGVVQSLLRRIVHPEPFPLLSMRN